jgi:hypothetical protein
MLKKVRSIKMLAPLCIALFVLISPGCDKDDDDDNQEKIDYSLSATLDGDQEVPAVTTNGSGTFSGSYNKNTNALTYTVSWQQLSGPATDMHFHGPALAGEPAGVALAITGFTSAAQGQYSGTATLTEPQEADLLAGKWYVNIHTDLNKPGEIRGQVSAQ